MISWYFLKGEPRPTTPRLGNFCLLLSQLHWELERRRQVDCLRLFPIFFIILNEYFFLFCLILISSIFSFQAGKGGEYLCQWRHICRRGTLWNWDANYWGGCKKSSIKCFQRWRANEQRTKAEKNIFSLLSGWTTRGTGKGNWPGLLEGSYENIGLFLNWWVPAVFNHFWL